MKNFLLFTVITLLLFMFGCSDSKTLEVTYDDSITQSSIFQGDKDFSTIAKNFTLINKKDNSSIPVTSDMLSIDTSKVGEVKVKVSYNGMKTHIPVYICTPISDLDYENVPNTAYIFNDGDSKDYIITLYKGTDSTIVIPNYINKIKVTQLGDSAFIDNQRIKTVILPGIEIIRELSDDIYSKKGTFYNCNNLESVYSPKLLIVGINGFYNCNSLENIYMPEVNQLYPNAFYSCTKLKEIKLPKVNTIGAFAFSNCKNLKSITFSENRLSIGLSIFKDSGDSKNWNINVPEGKEKEYKNYFEEPPFLKTFDNTKKPTINGKS